MALSISDLPARRGASIAGWRCAAASIVWLGVAIATSPAQTPASRDDELPPEPAEAVARWTLASLQQLALGNNPTLAQAAAGADISRGLYEQAGLYPNPQLGYLRTDSDTSGTSRSVGVFVGQEIVTAGKIKKAQAAESWEIEQRNWSYAAQTQRVRNDVQLRYLDVLASQETLRITEELTSVAERSLLVTEQFFEGKQVSKSDVLQARIQLRTVQLARRDAEAQHAAAWKQLAAVTGCPALAPAPLVGNLTAAVAELDFESSYQRLLTESPLVHAAKARAMSAQGTYQLERANRFPNANVQVVAERDQIGKFSTVSTLVSMPVPIVNRNQGNVFRAAAETRESAAEIRRTELALYDQLAATFRRYESAKKNAEQIREGILPDAEEALQLAVETYQGGETTFLTVLTAQRTLYELRMASADALAEAHKTVVEIEGLLLTGALNPAELGAALQSGGSGQRRAILQQLEGGANSSVLPAAVQTGGP